MLNASNTAENTRFIRVIIGEGKSMRLEMLNLGKSLENFDYPRFEGHRLVYLWFDCAHHIVHYATGGRVFSMEPILDFSKEYFFEYALEYLAQVPTHVFEKDVTEMRQALGDLYPANS